MKAAAWWGQVPRQALPPPGARQDALQQAPTGAEPLSPNGAAMMGSSARCPALAENGGTSRRRTAMVFKFPQGSTRGACVLAAPPGRRYREELHPGDGREPELRVGLGEPWREGRGARRKLLAPVG